MAKRRERIVKVYEVMYDGKGEGAAGDGTFFHRTADKAAAEAFAKRNTCYGRDCTVHDREVLLSTARRWGCA